MLSIFSIQFYIDNLLKLLKKSIIYRFSKEVRDFLIKYLLYYKGNQIFIILLWQLIMAIILC